MELKLKDLPEEGVLKASKEVAQKIKEMGYAEDESDENQDSEDDDVKKG